MLDYNEIYAGFGKKVGYYLDCAKQLDQAGNNYMHLAQNMHLAQKKRIRRLANLAWILMNQPADENGCINLSLEDILKLLLDGKDERRISPGVLQSDMNGLGASIGIKFAYDPKDGKIFIKPMK